MAQLEFQSEMRVEEENPTYLIHESIVDVSVHTVSGAFPVQDSLSPIICGNQGAEKDSKAIPTYYSNPADDVLAAALWGKGGAYDQVPPVSDYNPAGDDLAASFEGQSSVWGQCAPVLDADALAQGAAAWDEMGRSTPQSQSPSINELDDHTSNTSMSSLPSTLGDLLLFSYQLDQPAVSQLTTSTSPDAAPAHDTLCALDDAPTRPGPTSLTSLCSARSYPVYQHTPGRHAPAQQQVQPAVWYKALADQHMQLQQEQRTAVTQAQEEACTSYNELIEFALMEQHIQHQAQLAQQQLEHERELAEQDLMHQAELVCWKNLLAQAQAAQAPRRAGGRKGGLLRWVGSVVTAPLRWMRR